MTERSKILIVCLAIVLLLLSEHERLREHWLYFTDDRGNVAFDFGELSESWTESSLRQHFPGAPIRCYPNPGEGLGDTGCIVDTKSHNGIPALFISFFFSHGQLDQVSVNIPWWNHAAAYSSLEASYGPPSASQILPHGGVRLHGWRLPDGAALFYNRDKSLNPLQWNAIHWRSASACRSGPCFKDR